MLLLLHLCLVAAFHTPRGECGRNFQATRCVLGGKFRVKAVTLFLTPPFRQTPNEAKGGSPYKQLSMALCFLSAFMVADADRCCLGVFNEITVFVMNEINTR